MTVIGDLSLNRHKEGAYDGAYLASLGRKAMVTECKDFFYAFGTCLILDWRVILDWID